MILKDFLQVLCLNVNVRIVINESETLKDFFYTKKEDLKKYFNYTIDCLYPINNHKITIILKEYL